MLKITSNVSVGTVSMLLVFVF